MDAVPYHSLKLFFGGRRNYIQNIVAVLPPNLLYRHGDRSPLSSFPQNSVKEDAWPWGYGQLTKTGIQQAYNLGQWLKDRYKNFLSPSYKPKEIYVQSTDYDRTIMSAEVVLAGLFPPSAEEEWNPDIHWQPIPVHTMPLSEEKSLRLGAIHLSLS
uniref:acid phosphatase n=1 Tax=Pseudonaja textilis TaxID=8673 RepID=A0A670YVA4_PSETE